MPIEDATLAFSPAISVRNLRKSYGLKAAVAELNGRRQTDAAGSLQFRQVAFLEGGREFVHLTEGRASGDRLLAERPGIGDRPQQPAVNVDGATTHARDDSGLFQVEPGEPAGRTIAGTGRQPGRPDQEPEREGAARGSARRGSAGRGRLTPVHLPDTASGHTKTSYYACSCLASGSTAPRKDKTNHG